MENNESLLSNDLQVDHHVQAHLKETATWAKFLAIVGFILTGLIFLISAFAGTFLTTLERANPDGISYGGTMKGLLTVVYIVLGAISFFMSLFTWRFAVRTKNALLTNDQDNLNTGFMNLKFLFRFYGILMIIYLGFLLLALLGGIVGTMAR